MTRFSRADLEAVVELLGEACEVEGTVPFPEQFLERMQTLLGGHVTSYAHFERSTRTWIDWSGAGDGEDNPELEEHYWNVVHECPTFNYRDTTGDPSAVRIQDLITRRAWHRLAIYNEYFRPLTFEHLVEVGLPAPQGQDRFIVVFRHPDATDFSERDRDILQLLRPHLVRMHQLAQLRANVARATQGDASRDARLTPREQEVLELVARGKTNAEIAAALWVAPSTVKKHLEHVYAKIGIGRRAAAAARYAPPWEPAQVSGRLASD